MSEQRGKHRGNPLCLLLFAVSALFSGHRAVALDISDPYEYISDIMEVFTDENEGRTTFRSLNIPSGGRAEAMGSAFTAMADDAGCIETNPAGTATLKNTEIALYHNNWIADSKLETLSFVNRAGNLGYGASLRCFYVPFTEYNTFGERVSRGYYSETFATLNVSYNFLAGYYFRGIAVGANLKAGYRSVPNYSDNYGYVDDSSGLSQSAFTVMGDAGMQVRFNLLKHFSSREPNFSLGLSLRNFGPPVMGEPLPSAVTAGIAWRPIRPVSLAMEFQQPLNFVNFSESGIPAAGLGLSVTFTEFFTFLSGFQLKGGNPRFSIGSEMRLRNLEFSINYTLDLTTQLSLLNRISLGLKLNLGDGGRAARAQLLEDMYLEGLTLYAEDSLEEAIAVWEEILRIDPTFDPAAESVKTAAQTLELRRRIIDIQQLE